MNKIEFKPFNKTTGPDFCTFTRLYKDYFTELSAISPSISDSVKESDIFNMCRNRELERYLISFNDNIVGFLLIGIEGNKHPDSDKYIGEFYIAKQYQSQGIGKEVMTEYLRKNKQKYSLYILKKNERAILFWNNVFNACGYKDISWKYTAEKTAVRLFFKMYKPIEESECSQIAEGNLG